MKFDGRNSEEDASSSDVPSSRHAVNSLGVAAAVSQPGDDETDEYFALLASLGRSEDEDERISVHEAGHAIAARLMGYPLGGATINPDPGGTYGGLVWGPRANLAIKDEGPDVPELCDKLRDMMPKDGEARADTAHVLLHAQNRCIELLAASVAERLLLVGEPKPSVSDVRHAISYAWLVCRSQKAVEQFLRLCETMADDLLRPYGDLIIALALVLRMQRTLDGDEIDQFIWRYENQKSLAIEQRRRAMWKQAEIEAARFRAQCVRLDAAQSSHIVQGLSS